MESDGFHGEDSLALCVCVTQIVVCSGFMQKRFPNGTFAVVDPVACSAQDPQPNRDCSVQSDNTVGFYESSSWEYSWFVQHDMAHLVALMGGNVSQTRNYNSPLHWLKNP